MVLSSSSNSFFFSRFFFKFNTPINVVIRLLVLNKLTILFVTPPSAPPKVNTADEYSMKSPALIPSDII